jgi:transposase
VRVPSPTEEGARDLVRAREDARGDLMCTRHRLSKLLLRRGLVWEAGAWTQAHERWLATQRFEQRGLQIAYGEAVAVARELAGWCWRLATMDTTSPSPVGLPVR